jgi:hypothetical protein
MPDPCHSKNRMLGKISDEITSSKPRSAFVLQVLLLERPRTVLPLLEGTRQTNLLFCEGDGFFD